MSEITEASNTADTIYRDVMRKIDKLSDDKASLSILRHGAGRTPLEYPSAWGIVLLDMSDEIMSDGDRINYAEYAEYTALTMYAVYMQGSKNVEQHRNQSLGTACGLLSASKSTGESELSGNVKKRFDRLVLADDMDSLSHYLISMIGLLKQNEISLDYGKLAKDLFFWQMPKEKENIVMKWERDFYKTINQFSNKKETENNEE